MSKCGVLGENWGSFWAGMGELFVPALDEPCKSRRSKLSRNLFMLGGKWRNYLVSYTDGRIYTKIVLYLNLFCICRMKNVLHYNCEEDWWSV